MQYKNHDDLLNPYRKLLAILLLEIMIFWISGISFSALHGNGFISMEQDPFLWVAYLTGVPQFLLQSSLLCHLADALVLVFGVLLIIFPFKRLYAVLFFLLMVLFYITYTGHLTHRNYQAGYILIPLLFLFKSVKYRKITFEFLRYFLLFFYVSAAWFKLVSGSVFSPSNFIYILAQQFNPYHIEHHTNVQTHVNSFLLQHPSLTGALYIGAFLFEAAMLIGFFTKKYDKVLCILLIAFHLFNWLLMDIAPIGHLSFIALLFFSNKLAWKNEEIQLDFSHRNV